MCVRLPIWHPLAWECPKDCRPRRSAVANCNRVPIDSIATRWAYLRPAVATAASNHRYPASLGLAARPADVCSCAVDSCHRSICRSTCHFSRRPRFFWRLPAWRLPQRFSNDYEAADATPQDRTVRYRARLIPSGRSYPRCHRVSAPL